MILLCFRSAATTGNTKMCQKTVTVKQIQKLDKMAIEKIGIPSLVLMENAGKAVADQVLKNIKAKKNPCVCVICGLGNNAGDGCVAARHLINAGVKTTVYVIGKGEHLKHDAAVNYRILKKLKYPTREVGNVYPQGNLRSMHFGRDIQKADTIVDAIFGVGLNRDVQEPFRSVIETVNQEAKTIVAVDIPSGLDGTSGRIYGVCVKADVTVTFSFIKRGFLEGKGPRHTGKIIIADIGIPAVLKDKI